MLRITPWVGFALGLCWPVQAQPAPTAWVRLVARDGSATEAALTSRSPTAWLVQIAGATREVPVEALERVVFLPQSAAAPTPGIEVAPRCAWRLDAPLWQVLGELAQRSGRRLVVEPELSGWIQLELPDATWRDALSAVAGSVGRGLIERAGELTLASFAVRAPFTLVGPRPLPPPQPLPVVESACRPVSATGWLQSVQESDGRWSAVGPGHGPGPGDALTTSLCLLAYLGNGHTHRFGTHKATVNRGLQWLKRLEPAAPGWETETVAPLVARAMVACALIETYTVSRDFTVKRYAEKALETLLAARTPRSGWGLAPGDGPDAFSTVHGVLAVKAARTAGLDVPPGVLIEASQTLRRMTDRAGLTGFRAPGQGLSLSAGSPDEVWPLPLFSAGAALARLCAGEERRGVELRLVQDQLLAARPHPRRPDPAYWWWGSYAMFQVGGEGWTRWSEGLQEAVLLTQRDEPLELSGSWEPTGIYGQLGGRAAATAATLLALEVYYRWERAQEVDRPEPR